MPTEPGRYRHLERNLFMPLGCGDTAISMALFDDETIPDAADRRDADALRVVIFGPEGARTVPLAPGRSITLGRSRDVDIQLEDHAASRQHLLLRVEPDADAHLACTVRDLGSSNGTRLRGERIEAERDHAFDPGDPIEVGSTTIVVQRGREVQHARRLATHGHFEVRLEEDAGARGRSVSDAAGHDATIVIEDEAMRRLYALAERVASSEIGILLLGETGVGKEVLARTIHTRSPRAGGPFLAVNCGAFTEELLESELFGHERGAFTGAIKTRKGLFEAANGGTVFLDEIGETTASTQVRLLRVIEARSVRRLGGDEDVGIDVRFVAATNRNLELDVSAGRFREDLFYRLNGVSLWIPPLRERKTEIVALATSFLRSASRRAGSVREPELAGDAVSALERYAWPGNIRELRNVMERAFVLSDGHRIDTRHLPMEKLASSVVFSTIRSDASPSPQSQPVSTDDLDDGSGDSGPLGSALAAFERERIVDALRECAGNQSRAAEKLGVSRRTLLRRIGQYGIARPRKDRVDD